MLKKIKKHEMRNHLIDLTMARTQIESKNGFSPAALSLKYISTEETQARWELNVASLGAGGLEAVENSSGIKKENNEKCHNRMKHIFRYGTVIIL